MATASGSSASHGFPKRLRPGLPLIPCGKCHDEMKIVMGSPPGSKGGLQFRGPPKKPFTPGWWLQPGLKVPATSVWRVY